jgi:hypothetical protein
MFANMKGFLKDTENVAPRTFPRRMKEEYIRCVNTTGTTRALNVNLYMCDRKYAYAGPERSPHRHVPDRRRRLRVGPRDCSEFLRWRRFHCGFSYFFHCLSYPKQALSSFLQDQQVVSGPLQERCRALTSMT